MKLLRIDSSARRSSVSRQLTGRFAEAWLRQHPDSELIERDLARTHLPLITDEFVQAMHADPASRTAGQQETLAASDALIDELLAADTIVIGAPMYNFAISSLLKAWIDQVVRVGRTVRWSADGRQGMLQGKKVYVLTSRGGSYRPGAPAERFDYQEPYLRHILAFVGLTDVTFVHAENQKPGAPAELGRAAAIAEISRLAGEGADVLVQ